MDDREKLIELICEACRKAETCNSIIADECRTSYGDCGFCTITADHLIANGVVVRKQGEWVCTDIFPWGKVYRCLECGCDVDVTQLTNYCPDCGAKMKEVK